MQEVSKIEARGESLVLIGDMNKHIVLHNEGKDENKNVKEDHGGKLLREFVEGGDYVILNDTDKSSGGPYTRYSPEDPNNEKKKSTLDLVVVSKNLYEYVEKIVIDKDLKITPYRAISKTRLCYTDHYALIVIFKNLPRKTEINRKQYNPVIWNTNKKGAWKKYFEKTDVNMELDKAVEDAGDDANDLSRKINKILTNIKHASFGKVRFSGKPKEMKKRENLQKKKV